MRAVYVEVEAATFAELAPEAKRQAAHVLGKPVEDLTATLVGTAKVEREVTLNFDRQVVREEISVRATFDVWEA